MNNNASCEHIINIEDIIAENAKRNKQFLSPYDQLTGLGCCGARRQFHTAWGETLWLPVDMLSDNPGLGTLSKLELERLRLRYDFEYWCARCATIAHKLSRRETPFLLNAPQRRLAAAMEQQRQAGKPVRIILLKARQWGGSTLVQLYMAWVQIVLRRGWNSLICGHLRSTAAAIRGMYSRLLRNYPKEMLDGGTPLQFKPFEHSASVSAIAGRDCLVMTSSAQTQEAARGYDIAMAHLSEVGFWPSSDRRSPQDVVRSVAGTVALEPGTVIVMESTANGMGTFFHSEWLRARAGLSDKQPIFVPWHEIEIYRRPIADAARLWRDMDDYERRLWEGGCTLEMIAWYHEKRKEYDTQASMMAEFPSNDIEAWASTSRCMFPAQGLERLREGCRKPMLTGDVTARHKSLAGIKLEESPTGPLKVWEMPNQGERYVASVDVGGRSASADFSVISVISCGASGIDKPRVVAQWRGHTFHDLLAWKAAQLAQFFNSALLVVESNTLEMENAEGDSGTYLLTEVATHYRNVYARKGGRLGFQTNAQTKHECIYHLIALVRDGEYVERDGDAIDEMSWFELKPNGRSMGAMRGKHDDIVMSRAIGLRVIAERQQALRRAARLDIGQITSQPSYL